MLLETTTNEAKRRKITLSKSPAQNIAQLQGSGVQAKYKVRHAKNAFRIQAVAHLAETLPGIRVYVVVISG
jgi:hypothetical protein